MHFFGLRSQFSGFYVDTARMSDLVVVLRNTFILIFCRDESYLFPSDFNIFATNSASDLWQNVVIIFTTKTAP